MTVQSIGATIQVRDVGGYHLLVAAGKMAFRKMDRVGEFDNLAQEIWPRSETLDDAWYLLPARSGSPKVVSCCRLACGLVVLNDTDLGIRAGSWRICTFTFAVATCRFRHFPLTTEFVRTRCPASNRTSDHDFILWRVPMTRGLYDCRDTMRISCTQPILFAIGL